MLFELLYLHISVTGLPLRGPPRNRRTHSLAGVTTLDGVAIEPAGDDINNGMISSGYDTLWLLIIPYILIYHICWWWFISIIPHYDTLWYIMIINNPICNNPIKSHLKLLYLYSGKSGIIYAVCTVIKWYVWSWNLIYGIIMIEWSANKLLLLFMG